MTGYYILSRMQHFFHLINRPVMLGNRLNISIKIIVQIPHDLLNPHGRRSTQR